MRGVWQGEGPSNAGHAGLKVMTAELQVVALAPQVGVHVVLRHRRLLGHVVGQQGDRPASVELCLWLCVGERCLRRLGLFTSRLVHAESGSKQLKQQIRLRLLFYVLRGWQHLNGSIASQQSSAVQEGILGHIELGMPRRGPFVDYTGVKCLGAGSF